jgi:NAD(P)-dependent dehydrogenase (short-subunit alcohol dehydrogenase family)
MATNLTGKVALVTGATAGIGEVTARELARMGAPVVGIGRNPQKCADVAASIRSQTGNQAVEYLVADLSSMHEIIRVTDEFRSKYQRLDLLINNAGAYFQQHKVSVDGFEMTFALNHMNYFLVTRQLLDMLKAVLPHALSMCIGAHTADADLPLQMTQRYGNWLCQLKFANCLYLNCAPSLEWRYCKYMRVLWLQILP